MLYLPNSLDITPEMVIQGQGADPELIHNRKPELFNLARNVIMEGKDLIKPQILFDSAYVQETLYDKIKIQRGVTIQDELFIRGLTGAIKLFFIICTIGDLIDKKVSELFSENPVMALSYEGLGVAAIEALQVEACRMIQEIARQNKLAASIPFSPGMEGWPLKNGQNLIFTLLKPDPQIVNLNSSYQMVPQKTTSMVIGIGNNFSTEMSPCAICLSRKTCRYKPHKRN